MWKRSRLTALIAVLGGLVAIGVALTIVARPGAVLAGQTPASAHPATYAVAADLDACGQGWGEGANAHVPGGDQTFTVTNHTVAGIEVYLQAVDTNKVYLDLESLGAAAHATARATLGAGRYRFICLPADADPVRGPTVTVGSPPHSAQLTPGIVPVTRNDLIPVAKAYGTWVSSRIPVLRQQVARVGEDASEGDLAAARRDWLTAHLTYETLGAAYGSFGDLDTAINGMPGPGLTAATDTKLTGFHRVEGLLWSGAPAAAVAAAVGPLAAAVGRLGAAFADAEVDPLDVGLRAHEIVENAIQFDLTGSADTGSGTELASIDAELTGAGQALAQLHGILSSRYDQLATTTSSLASSHRLIETFRHADGTWVPLAHVSRPDRERIDASLGATVELLAPVAAICDIRRGT
ncbi:imelysin family protein [Leifsonia sp. NPDC058248]|uniref:imelysin family protein n=1 Tax=Leifsonia sp. NPDC058248 TaxID=3346402 RepID=UPI0036DC1DD7